MIQQTLIRAPSRDKGGWLAEARPLAERALAITQAAYGPDHPTVAMLQANLDLFAINQDQSVEDDSAG
jgi:hypothetical protein